MVRFDRPLPSWVDRANKYRTGNDEAAAVLCGAQRGPKQVLCWVNSSGSFWNRPVTPDPRKSAISLTCCTTTYPKPLCDLEISWDFRKLPRSARCVAFCTSQDKIAARVLHVGSLISTTDLWRWSGEKNIHYTKTVGYPFWNLSLKSFYWQRRHESRKQFEKILHSRP